VAEMGAAFLCAIAGIANQNTERNTTAYIQNWISKLEEDNRLIVHAAATAQRAVDLILGPFSQSADLDEPKTGMLPTHFWWASDAAPEPTMIFRALLED
jgi:antirestriction protein ArdC